MSLMLHNLEDSLSIAAFHVIPDILLERRVRRNELQKLHEASWFVEVISSSQIDLF